ncbi:MAG: 16S rRNA (cytidine(1402)-2'-O)-methyltransferase, partial [Pseudomonadota bacterium]|nr:16S rRNA (cytidine(1402)-2'-O)-methyltransferase [Pseudomonadota bacterium]
KAYEQWIRGTASEARATLGDETRGEVVLLVGGAPEGATIEPAALDAEITRLAGEGLGARDIAAQLAAATGLPRREVYQRVLELSRSGPPRR